MQQYCRGKTEVVVVPLEFVQDKFHSFHPVATILSYLTKAPLVSNAVIVSALVKT
jgi:hypothetical protein